MAKRDPKRAARTIAELAEESRRLIEHAAGLVKKMNELASEVAETRAEAGDNVAKSKGPGRRKG